MIRRFLASGLPALGLMLTIATGCGPAGEPADLVLLNGKIATVDPDLGEVAALAARGGRIVAVGDDETVRGLVGPDTRVIDLEGARAIPGFIEGHGHFTGLGQALMNVDLNGAASWDEVVRRAAEAAAQAQPGEWIVGRGWHQEKWDAPPRPNVEGYPLNDALSAAVPDHPVHLRHASGHASIANAMAMELAGIDASTPDPAGGKILRDASGRPTGVLRETASGLVGRALERAETGMTAEQLEARQRRAIALAAEECLKKGVTSFQDAGSSFETVDLLRKVAEEGDLGVRLWMMLRESNAGLAQRAADYRIQDVADHHLTVGGIKRSIDGALGSHGAWLLEPYEDQPDSVGLNTTPIDGDDGLRRTAQIALEHGYQLCVHAIGDRGNRETLDVFEEALAGRDDGDELRWRVEHAQHLSLDDIPRFARLGVVASMQAVHCTSDGPWVPTRLGERRSEEGAYVWRKLLESGAVVTNGTDTPVEDVSPVVSFHSAVTRQMRDGTRFYPGQVMTRTEALRAYTINAAYAAFEEGLKGSLTPGKLADVVVLSRDILTTPDDEIPGTEVLYTIVGGEVLYEGPG